MGIIMELALIVEVEEDALEARADDLGAGDCETLNEIVKAYIRRSLGSDLDGLGRLVRVDCNTYRRRTQEGDEPIT